MEFYYVRKSEPKQTHAIEKTCWYNLISQIC